MNAADDLLVSSFVKFCCNLNPNLIFGTGRGLADGVGTPIVVTPGGADVPFTGGELVLPRNEISIYW